MCGIFGFVTKDARLDARAVLEEAKAALHHRGPDDRGTFEGARGEWRVGLAHTRLAIIDLSAGGHQPMTTPDGRYTLVFNGEIYNFHEIRRELEAAGERLSSSSDTEVLLRGYARWGDGVLARLRGMFAFAVWDAAEGALFLARDRLGVKPLYYVASPSGVAFASEVRALLATGLAEKRLSPRAVVSYFAFGAVSEPDVILDGVSMLPPGHTLALRGGEATVKAYWELPLDEDPSAGFDGEVRAIQPILQDAVRLRLVADVPVGVFLSGGIDSSVVVALATRASSSPVHTFTVTFDEEAFSEASYAAEVARVYGCDHHQVHLPASQAARDMEPALVALDQPSVDGANTYFVSKAAREAGLTVALSGLGGDELFAGYPNFRLFGRILSVARNARRAPLGLRRGLGLFEGALWAPVAVRKLSALLASDGSPETAYAILRGVFTPEVRRSLLSDAAAATRAPLGVTIPGDLERRIARGSIHPVTAYSAFEVTNYLRNTLLRDTDVMSMAHALEVRVPLIDHVLVERVMRIPGHLKVGDRDNKPLLTAAVPSLPRTAVERSKMGFTLPYEAWFRGPLRGWMEDILLGERVARLGLLRPAGVERLWKSFLRGEPSITFARVWCIAAFVGWCEVNGVSI